MPCSGGPDASYKESFLKRGGGQGAVRVIAIMMNRIKRHSSREVVVRLP